MRYQLCELAIESEIPLADLASDETTGGADISLSYGHPVVQATDDHPWFHEWRYPDGELWNSFARVDSGYLCRFAGIADFHLIEGGERIVCSPVAGVPESTLGHIFLNQVVPIALSARGGRLVLHASAVAIDGGAVAFAGETGQGKSTLAGSFCRAGAPLVTDDFLVVEETPSELSVIPTYGGLRLWDDAASAVAVASAELPNVAHFSDKKRISLAEHQLPFCSGPVPLERIYLLGDDVPEVSMIGIEPIPARAAMMELTRYAFHLDLSVSAVREAEFSRLGKLAAAVPVYRLSYPRRWDELPTVQAAIRGHLRIR